MCDTVRWAQQWLDHKQNLSAASNPRAATRARHDDLCRWARALTVNTGNTRRGPYQLSEDLATIDLAALTSSDVAAALAALRDRYSPATCHRMLATLRTFTSWAYRRGLIETDPCDSDDVALAPAAAPVIHAFSDTDTDALIAAAGEPPAAGERAWCPQRDVAILRVLADCGPRAAELVALRDIDADTDADPPMLRLVHGTKWSRPRAVPLPARTCAAIEAWRNTRGDNEHLFVRNGGEMLDTKFVDRLIRRCARRAGVAMPGQAAAHGFRHHYGVQLAKRGVPVTVISDTMGHLDPRTTAIYTRMAGNELTAALDDAGWL